MKGRLRAIGVFGVILAVGALVGSALSQWTGRTSQGEPEPGRKEARERIRVEILNGGGHAGAAREATDQLRDVGFDVVFFGNAGSFDLDSSVVLDRTGRVEAARDVADALGIRNLRSEPDSNLYLDVSVVLGREWMPSASREPEVTEEAVRPWWDPRGWMHR
ncbi:MAG TPA: LytR C-terminal domain-containing protein [Longimicrobiales bacterium]|nr:LytR C-terminal domain-containing protein [Longimicrobiales bacterium]